MIGKRGRAATQASFDELAARVRAPSPPARRMAATVAEQVGAELERRARAEVAAKGRARLEWISAGGPCGYCGIAWSSVLVDVERDGSMTSEEQAFWRRGPVGPVCFECEMQRNPLMGAPIDDVSHRGWVAAELLGLQRWWVPAKLGERLAGVFLWWAETSPRPPQPASELDRFGWVDRAALRAAIEARAPRTAFHHGPACPACGHADRWVYRPAGLQAIRFDAEIRNMEVEAQDQCECGQWATPAPYQPAPAGIDTSLVPEWGGSPQTTRR